MTRSCGGGKHVRRLLIVYHDVPWQELGKDTALRIIGSEERVKMCSVLFFFPISVDDANKDSPRMRGLHMHVCVCVLLCTIVQQLLTFLA